MPKWIFAPCLQGSNFEAMQILLDINAGRISESEGLMKLEDEGYAQVADSIRAHVRDVCTCVESLKISDTRLNVSTDGGVLLWSLLILDLQKDESGFKQRVAVLDIVVKTDCQSITSLASMKAGDIMTVVGGCPWHGCIFVACVVLHMISKPDTVSKRETISSICRSLGGCSIPPLAELAETRWPYLLMPAYSSAVVAAVSLDTCTAIHINVTDVDIMRNPGKGWGRKRPGTFAHTCVMTVSPAGVFVLQGYGPRGYTLLQCIQEHDSEYPLSFDAGLEWVKKFEVFTGEGGGAWNRQVNSAYSYCFGVDLERLGNMCFGSQLDAHIEIKSTVFDDNTVRGNFSLLPQKDDRLLPCIDGISAKLKTPEPGYVPDGGVPRYYTPRMLRCASCGAKSHNGNQACSRCKKVYYCGKGCQTTDWIAGHKKVCKSLAAMKTY